MAQMFYGCSNLTSLDLSGFKTDNVTDMSYMFYYCPELTTIFVSEDWSTANVSKGDGMFTHCSNLIGGNGTSYNSNHTDVEYARVDNSDAPGYFTDINMEPWEPSKSPYAVWCKGNTTLYFVNSSKELKQGGTYDGQTISYVWSGETLTNWRENDDWASYTPMIWSGLLNRTCTRIVFDQSFKDVRLKSTSAWFVFDKLEKIEGLENFDTSEITSMDHMFLGCNKLKTIDLSHFDTHNVKYMQSMFEGCDSLTELDLSSFDTRNVQNMARMFAESPSLTHLDLSSFETGNVTNMRQMFGVIEGQSSLKSIDMSHFDTSNVTNMDLMFYGCSCLETLDVSSFNTSKVTDMWGMFSQCSSLKTIYAGADWSTQNVEAGGGMFGNCVSLVGGQGTAYDGVHFDYTYAHIDGGADNPGYFTSGNIVFADANVKAICVENWDTDDDGELSYDEAAAVTTLNSVFSERNDITLFNEFRYFTGLTELGDYSFYYCDNLQEISFPTTLTRIGEAAFFGDKALKIINLPEGLARIEHAAFGLCTSLTSLYIPKTVTYISNNGMAFRDCTGLTSITVDEQNQVYDSRNQCNAIIEKESLRLVNGCKTTVIPNGIVEIGMGAFYGQYDITELELPTSVKTIGDGAYDGCGFDTLRIPNTVETICFGAFWNCRYLTAVILPENTPTLGSELFLSDKLSSVYSYNRNPTAIKDDAFDVDWYGTMTTATLYVPAGCKSKYETTEGWKRFQNIVEMEEDFPGDINRDGQVGIGDIVAVTNVMAGSGGSITQERADVNGDGQVGIGDIVAITNTMAGKE